LTHRGDTKAESKIPFFFSVNARLKDFLDLRYLKSSWIPFILVEEIFGKGKRVKNLFDPDTFFTSPPFSPSPQSGEGTYGGEVKGFFFCFI